jgi:hypothetical protein
MPFAKVERRFTIPTLHKEEAKHVITNACHWARSSLRMVVLAAAVAAAPLPALAGNASSLPAGPPAGPGIAASGARLVAVELARPAAPGAQVRLAVTPQTDLGSPSFFKTPAGIITLVAIAAGVSYALYSTSHDRIKSPAR